MVGLDLKTALAAFALVFMGLALVALKAGNIRLAGVSFFSVALFIYAREEWA